MYFIYCHLNFHANLLRPWRFPLILYTFLINLNLLGLKTTILLVLYKYSGWKNKYILAYRSWNIDSTVTKLVNTYLKCVCKV